MLYIDWADYAILANMKLFKERSLNFEQMFD